MTDKKKLIANQKIFSSLTPEQLQVLGQHCTFLSFDTNHYLAKEGDRADDFYILIQGDLAIELHTAPAGERTLLTLMPGDLAGWSWIFPPYHWLFDLKTRSDSKVLKFDAVALREQCEKDPVFGYSLMRLFVQVMSNRLKATRIQLLDIYGVRGP